MSETPVLLITFNRPETTNKVLTKLREARITKLYIFNDGPRKNNKNDQLARESILDLIEKIDWGCDVKRKFIEENLGCGNGVVNAIDWAFKHEDKLIILEDDCVPAISFFKYADELLDYYEDDKRIWLISGSNFTPQKTIPYSYAFTHYLHIWGWATWKRVWNEFSLFDSNHDEFMNTGDFDNIFTTFSERKYFKRFFNSLFNNPGISSHAWSYSFLLHIYKNGGMGIIPAENLISNIGVTGVHTSKGMSVHHRTTSEDFKITSHPTVFQPIQDYERYHFKNHILKINRNNIKRILRRIYHKLKQK